MTPNAKRVLNVLCKIYYDRCAVGNKDTIISAEEYNNINGNDTDYIIELEKNGYCTKYINNSVNLGEEAIKYLTNNLNLFK